MSTAIMRTARDYASLIKLSHSVFALPFALLSLLVAARGDLSARLLLLCVAAVFLARTSAMAYNRWLDRAIDAENPRTKGREIPRGAVKAGNALLLAIGSGGAFLWCCALLSPTCGYLGVPVLAFLLGYSHTKRYTALCHLWLGVALGIAPVAAWVAGQGNLVLLGTPMLLGLGVACWVAGFDITYACQDEHFDRAHGLHSIPVLLGVRRAMWVSRLLHASSLLLFVMFGRAASLGTAYTFGVVAAGLLLGWQHWQLRRGDSPGNQAAFFTANGILSIAMLAAGCADLYLFA
ncbi:MAG: 4-hydroxybenzoate octaprenyltransferase [Planctomycetes bacterium]|nr:4-hydroxybenzoate octaprenyltransferase [Planctomycetota bacterium]